MAWGWLAVVVVLSIFNTVLGEELLFPGLLLPQMRGDFVIVHSAQSVIVIVLTLVLG